MKIPDFRSDEIRSSETQLQRPEKVQVKREESPSERSADRATISPFSETLLSSLDSTSRVEALKSSFEAGTYRVDPESLAKALIKSALTNAEPNESPARETQVLPSE